MTRSPNLTEFNLLQTQAEDILGLFRERFGFPDSPPVPVEMIARFLLGLRCESGRFARWDERSVGGLCLDDRIVFADERFNWNQYIFGVAHEIGHWVLHEGNCCSQLHFGPGQSMPANHLLSSMSAKTKKQKARLREIEANRFAGALLIPRSFLFSQAIPHEVIDAKAVRQLARLFHVSMDTMLYRISNLSVHLAWRSTRIDWDSLYSLESALRRRWHTESQGTYSTPSMSRSIFIPSRKSKDRSLAKASRVLGEYLRTQRRKQVRQTGVRKPLVLEFAGTPNAGKDTLIAMIRDYLEDMCKHKARVFDEGIKSCHSDTELDKELNLDRLYKATAVAVLQLYEASTENPGNYDFVIFNRGLFDLLAWLHAARVCSRISEQQEHIHRDYLLSYAHLQDISFLFLTSPDDSLRREEEERMRNIVVNLATERGEEGTPGDPKVHNKEMLSLLNSSYCHMYDTYQDRFAPIYLFDFANWDDASTLEESLSGKFRGVVDAILPRHAAQLPLPQLFGIRYVNGNSSGNRISMRRPSAKTPDQLATQLSFLGNERVQPLVKLSC